MDDNVTEGNILSGHVTTTALPTSKIQGLGLYAAKDLEKHTMVIEYIGEIIRSELSEIREKQYEAKAAEKKQLEQILKEQEEADNTA